MQWVPAHIGINKNDTAYALAKEAKKLNNDELPFVDTMKDINSVTRTKFKDGITNS